MTLLLYFGLATFALVCHYIVYHIIYTSRLYQKRISKRPAWLPYSLPYFGHSLQLLTDPYSLLKSAKHPVRLRLPGMNPFLIQGVDNVRRLLKAASDTNPAHAQNFIASQLFGMPASAAKLFQEDDSGYAAAPRPGSKVAPHNRICYRDRKLLLDMFQGRELECVISRFRAAFDRRMAQLMSSTITRQEEGGEDGRGEGWHEMPDLWEFLTTHVTPAAIEALCGSVLVQDIDEDFVRDFWDFDAWVPAITKGVPAWLFPQAYRVRDKLLDSLVRWRSLDWQRQPPPQRTCTDEKDEATRGSPSMMAKMDLLEVDGWSLQAIAASDLGLIWASNSNTISAIYWLNVELFRSRERLRRVRAECLSARRRSGSGSSHDEANDKPALRQGTPSCLDIDLPALLTQPYLQACFAETLRLRTHIFITRFVDARDMDINEWSIPARSVSLTCSSVPHMDAALWSAAGSAADTAASATPLTAFVPERFLRMPIDPSSDGPARRTCKLHAYDSCAINALGEQPLPSPVSSSSSSSSPTCPAACECTQQFSTKGLDGIWIPFGGGAQMCPGRKLAKAETFLVTAVLTSLFDIELCNPDGEIPVKSSHFGTGVSKPAAKTPFRIRRRQ